MGSNWPIPLSLSPVATLILVCVPAFRSSLLKHMNLLTYVGMYIHMYIYVYIYMYITVYILVFVHLTVYLKNVSVSMYVGFPW